MTSGQGRHIGRVLIDWDVFLDYLQFSGGSVYRIGKARIGKAIEYHAIEIIIEHPDMPTVEQGAQISDVRLIYTREEDAEGHLVAIRRTSPPVGPTDSQREPTGTPPGNTLASPPASPQAS